LVVSAAPALLPAAEWLRLSARRFGTREEECEKMSSCGDGFLWMGFFAVAMLFLEADYGVCVESWWRFDGLKVRDF
jgi:hypothetical protein